VINWIMSDNCIFTYTQNAQIYGAFLLIIIQF